MAIALVIALSGSTESGAGTIQPAADNPAPVHSERTDESAGQSGSARTSGSLPGGAKADRSLGSAPVRSDSCPSARKALRFYRAAYLGWRSKMGAAESRAGQADPEGTRPGKDRPRQYEPGACPRYLAHLWQRKAHAARVAFLAWHRAHVLRYRALYEKWRCIHEHEGAWNANTGNGYWGGLQMDWGFMHTYGPEFIRRYGLAHRWPVWAQLEAAERAYHGFAGYGGRGYSPWGTRGACGV